MSPAAVSVPVGYRPDVLDIPTGNSQGGLHVPPLGCILHGTRSGIAKHSVTDEFEATCRYVTGGSMGLAWNVTIGEDAIAIHLPPSEWGWNAREASSQWLAAEFAQPTSGDAITDGQVRAFAWWMSDVVRPVWPRIEYNFIGHSELPAGIRDGKNDPFPMGSAKLDELRRRLLAHL